jgi:hypothetical protein
MSVAYGIEVRPEGGPFLGGAENVLRALALGKSKEASLFDTIPWCICCCLCPHNKRFTDEFAVIHMPSWFPGARLKHDAREWRLVVENVLQTTFDKVKGELVGSPDASRPVKSPMYSFRILGQPLRRLLRI